MICKRGGFIIQRHNELRDFEAEPLRMICNGVGTEPVLQDITGEELNRIYLIGTNFRGHLIWRKKGQHISRVFILAIWVQNYFLRELIFAKMKKKTYFENFIIILHFLLLKIINS